MVKKPAAVVKKAVATKASPTSSKEATVRSKAKERGWTLEKVVGGYRLLDGNGTWMAADWETGNGLSLAAIEAALA
ncbi:hypothetical protein BH18ACT5_BH18ACT5_06150 [soil metagenome]